MSKSAPAPKRAKVKPAPYYTVEEAAAVAGVSVSTLRHWIYTGRLSSVRPGRRRMIRQEVLAAFLDDSVFPKSGADRSEVALTALVMEMRAIRELLADLIVEQRKKQARR